MFRFKNLVNKFSRENLRKFTPYLMIAIFLTAIIVPVWADTYTEVSDFASFKTAVTTTGGKIRLMADIEDTESGPLELYSNVTIDLNGHMLSKKNINTSVKNDKNRYFIIVRNGTLTLENSQAGTTVGNVYASAMADDAAPRTVAANTAQDGQHAKVIVNSGVKITCYNSAGYENCTTGPHALMAYTMYETDEHAYDTGQSAEVIVNEGATISGCNRGVIAWGYNTKVTINGGNISSRKCGISIDCGGKGEINGGDIKGSDIGGAKVDHGTLTINGGTLSSTGNGKKSIQNSWSTDDEDLAGCSAPSKITINGGIFENRISVDENENITTTITGGKFKENPTSLLSDKYVAELIDNYYVVSSNENPVEIGTKEELKAFRDRVNNGATALKGKLTADIDLENEEWTPIGNNDTGYTGTFDGQGHKISGLYISSTTSDRHGLFGLIRNTTIQNITVSGEMQVAGTAGGIVGWADNATISNCKNECNITVPEDLNSYANIAGICAYATNTTISGCKNTGELAYKSASSSGGVAGICGDLMNASSLSNCVNEGAISAKGNATVGGICMEASLGSGETYAISHCVNKATISGGNIIGGIVGGSTYAMGDVNIIDCENRGELIATSSSSYIAGICGGVSSGKISGCINSGNIDSAGTNNRSNSGICIASQSSSSNTTLTIESCVNKGTVGGSNESSHNSAGICDGISDSAYVSRTIEIKNCCNLGAVNGSGICGNLYFGDNAEDTVTISNCVNSGAVYLSGIFEQIDLYGKTTLTVKNCVNEGTVSNSSGICGNIWDYSASASVNIMNCMNTGRISNSSSAAICGNMSGGTISLSECGYLKGTATQGIGSAVGSKYETDKTQDITVYEADAVPAAAVLFDLPSTLAEDGPALNAATIYPTIAYNKSSVGITLSSSNSEVASIVSSSKVKGNSAGDATISATVAGLLGGETLNLSKTVNTVEVETEISAITLNKTSMELIGVDETEQLKATLTPSNASVTALEWTSSDESIATVNNGVVKVVGEGKATITAKATDGSGVTATCEVTAYEAIPIRTKAELEAFRDRVNAGETKLSAKLYNDIDLQGSEDNQWTPIESFKGSFDGCGHTISGLYINSSSDYQGLFSYVWNNGKISNVIVDGTVKGHDYVGGIVGCFKVYDDRDEYAGKISNCVSKVKVSGDNRVGGICGEASGNIDVLNCVNIGTVSGGSVNVGGVCGNACASDYGSIALRNCLNTGTISSGGVCGAVCGNISDYDTYSASVQNCGYLEGTAEKGIGSISGSTTDTTTKYTSSNLPATSALITLNSLMIEDKKAAVTIYPENAYNKGSVSYALSSSDTNVATVNDNNVTGVGKGTATISGTVSGLLGSSSVEISSNINVKDGGDTTNYRVIADQQGAIPTGTITAKIKVLLKDLEEKAITGIQAVVNYATDILEFVSAEKSSIEGTTTPVTEVAGEIGFGLVSTSGIEFTEGQYYDFGTMTFKVKQGVSAGTISNLFITDATYMLTDYTEKTATTTGADIEIYQPVTNINITSQTGSTTMLVENTLQLEAEILPETAKTKDIEWISGDESIATVDANGLVTAQLISGKTAVVIITAKALDGSGVTGTIQLTVKRPNVASMNFAQAAYELKTDDTTQNLYSELSVAPSTALKPAANEITWSSSNANFAVDENGVVSIVTATEEKQSTTITAKYTNEAGETITATCTVNSKPKKINLNLATKLEGRQSGGGAGTNVELIEVYLYDSANNPLWNGTGTTDTSGNVTFEIDSSIIEEGQSVKLWIKGERYLAKLITQTVTLTGSDWNVTMPAMLKAADSNADNKVNLTDFGILGNSFLKKKGVTGFDARADYNADDKVNLTDFGFLGNNFLNKGDAKPQPAVGMLMAAAARNGTTETALTVLNPDTAKIAEQALANSSSTDEETQEEEILAAVQEATGADLNASKTPASANSSSDSQNNSTGGGCNAGFGAIALLFAMPFVLRKKK